jgi:hypothetical protein
MNRRAENLGLWTPTGRRSRFSQGRAGRLQSAECTNGTRQLDEPSVLVLGKPGFLRPLCNVIDMASVLLSFSTRSNAGFNMIDAPNNNRY